MYSKWHHYSRKFVRLVWSFFFPYSLCMEFSMWNGTIKSVSKCAWICIGEIGIYAKTIKFVFFFHFKSLCHMLFIKWHYIRYENIISFTKLLSCFHSKDLKLHFIFRFAAFALMGNTKEMLKSANEKKITEKRCLSGICTPQHKKMLMYEHVYLSTKSAETNEQFWREKKKGSISWFG